MQVSCSAASAALLVGLISQLVAAVARIASGANVYIASRLGMAALRRAAPELLPAAPQGRCIDRLANHLGGHGSAILTIEIEMPYWMSTYTATIRWSRTGGGDFARGQYSRAHEWAFDGGAVVPASPSPQVVPAPWSDQAGVDPEEAFVASLSSCHMLFFLDFARRAGFVVDSLCRRGRGRAREARRREDVDEPRHPPPADRLGRHSARRRSHRRPPPPRPRSLLHRQQPDHGSDGATMKSRPPQPCRRGDAVDREEPRALPQHVRCRAARRAVRPSRAGRPGLLRRHAEQPDRTDRAARRNLARSRSSSRRTRSAGSTTSASRSPTFAPPRPSWRRRARASSASRASAPTARPSSSSTPRTWAAC